MNIRKNRVIAYILSVFMVFGVVAAVMPLNLQASAVPPGTGAFNDPFLISTGEHLTWMTTPPRNFNTSTYFLVTQDIIAPQNLVIGRASVEPHLAFMGIFDGNGHTITLNINVDGNAGLFDTVGSSDITAAANGTVRNLRIAGSVVGTANVGGVAGINNGLIENVSVSANVTGTRVGGIAGSNDALSLSNGIRNTYTTGTVTSTGDVDAYNAAGGIVGLQANSSGSNIRYNYATGNVINPGAGGAGGIAGFHGTIGGHIRYNVALNRVVNSGFPDNTGRVVGNLTVESLGYNRALGAMLLNGAIHPPGTTGALGQANRHGLFVGSYQNQNFWENTMGWDFDDIWTWDSERNLPTLRMESTLAPPDDCDCVDNDCINENDPCDLEDCDCEDDDEIIAPPTYNVVINNNPAGAVTGQQGAGSYEVGETVNLTSGTKTGYTFVNWTAVGAVIPNPTQQSTSFDMPANNVTITANWTATGSDNGTNNNGTDNNGQGEDPDLDPDPDPQPDPDPDPDPDPQPDPDPDPDPQPDPDPDPDPQPQPDPAPQPTPTTHTLTLRARGGGTVALGTGSYGSSRTGNFEPGSQIVISARPSRDYYFDEWTYNGGSVAHPFRSDTHFVMPNRDVTIWANFSYYRDWRRDDRDDWRRGDWHRRDWTPTMPDTAAPTVPPPTVYGQQNIPNIPDAQPGRTWLRLYIDSPTYTLNGQQRVADVAPFIDPVHNRTMVPLRTISEALGIEIDWIPELQMVALNIDGTLRGLAINEPLPGGMGTAMLVNDRTFVPVAFIAQVFGAHVHWDGVNRVVYVLQ